MDLVPLQSAIKTYSGSDVPQHVHHLHCILGPCGLVTERCSHRIVLPLSIRILDWRVNGTYLYSFDFSTPRHHKARSGVLANSQS